MAIDASIYGNQPPPRFNTPFESLGQIGALRQQQQQIQSNQALEEERRQKVAKEKQIEADQAKFFDILSTSKTADEAAEKIRVGVPSFYQSFLKQRGEIDAKAEDVKKTAAEIKKLHAEVQVKGNEYAEPFFQLVEKSGNNPGVFEFALSHIQSQFPDFPADQYRQQAAQGGPEAIAQIVASRKSTQQQTADTGAARLAAETPTLQANAKIQGLVASNMSPQGLNPEQQAAGVRADRGAAEAARHNRVQEGLERTRTEKTATTRYQSKDVLDDNGKPVMANYDAVSGTYVNPTTGQPIKAPKPVPSAQEMMDSRKFQKAAPVLSAVSELSEKINTGQGLLAKARGGMERIAAKANYDDDVAEYQAIVSGFTPLVARSLGHTGVLTQQDVDSVKELFPKPGDSKTLRDRKVKRLMGIVGELEGTEGVQPKAPAGPMTGLTYQDYLKAKGR